MRRTVIYTAGLFLATGASFALAGTASAADACYKNKCKTPVSTPSTPSGTPSTGGGFGSYSANQWLGQSSVTNQTVLNNVGNPQIGLGKGNITNNGGSASATSTTTQLGGNFFGW